MNDREKTREQLIEELEARRAEARTARERALYLQEIIDGVADVIQVVDRDGRIRFSNRAFHELSGYSPEEADGMPMVKLCPPEDIQKMAEIGRFFDSPVGSTATFTSRCVDKSGGVHLLETTAVNRCDPPMCGIVGCARDIGDRSDWRESLESWEEVIGAVFDGVQDAVFVHDTHGAIVNVNQKMREMFGIIGPAELSDLAAADDYYGPHDMTEDMPQIWKAILAGGPRLFEWKARRPSDGTVFDVEVFLSSIRLKGREHILAAVRDISERRRVAQELERALIIASRLRVEAEAASAAKSEFLANMSHELRTPLNAIIGFSELLSDGSFGPLNERQREFTKVVFDSGHHLLRLINDILDLAKIEAGRMDLRVSRVTLTQLLRNSRTMIKEKAIRHGIALELSIPDDLLGAEIRADDVKLRQIIVNLLSNAAKFTPDRGSIRLQVERSGDELVISVADTGIGIKREHHERIFQAFEQVDSSYSRKQQGTGLGLSLTKRLVELHGGRIWVESEGDGKGSIFRFTIPFIEAEKAPESSHHVHECTKPAPADARPPGGRDSGTGQKLKVLVVEDNEANMKLASDLLELGGYIVLQARSAEEGIKKAQDRIPDLILMDISLPGMDGLAATQVLTRNEATKGIPIVALTAHAMNDDEARAKAVGCSAYVTKPIDTRTFYAVLASLLQGR
jgi:PAS domain S-box-containing protein